MNTCYTRSIIGALFLVSISFITSCAGYDETIDWPSSRPVVDQKILTQKSDITQKSSWKALERYPDPSGTLRLPDALMLALKYNPELKAFQERVRARDAAALQASLPPNPSVVLETEEFGGSGERSGFENAEFSANINQLILLGGELGNRTDLAEARRDLSAVDYEAKRIRVFTEVVQRFFDVLAMQKRVDLAEQTVELAEQVNDSVSSRMEAGDARPVEQSRAEIALENQRLRLERIRRRLANAKTRLASLWGNTDITFERVRGSFGDIPDLPSEKQLVQHVKQNPRITRWDLLVKKKKEKLDLEESEAVPNPKLKAGVQRKRFIDQTFGFLAVEFPLQLFDRNQGAIRKAKYELTTARWQRREARKDVLTKFTESYRTLEQLSKEVKRIKHNVVPKSKNVFEKIQTGYKEGAFNLLDVLDARRTYFQARSRYIQALSEYHAARAKVEGFVGKQLESIQ